MYEDGVDGDSLREVLEKACKRIDLGSAVIPKALLNPDVDELPLDMLNEDDDEDGQLLDVVSALREGVAPDDLYATSTAKSNRYSRTLHREFNAVVVEHHLKWAPLCVSEPGPLPDKRPCDRLGRYDFHHADAIVDWAIRHRMKVKGHVLCWHVTSPNALLEAMTPAQVEEELRRHIFTTMGHFRGRIRVWDVVNEALAPNGSLAETIFLRKLGPSYIEKCFRWAHQADPDAFLLYNDNKVEGMDGPNKSKADAFYRLLADLLSKGVPIHGCGIQAHFNGAGVGRNRCPTPRMVKNQIHRLGELGLTVNISEMDVRVSQLAPNLRQIAQRQIYRDIIAAALTEACFDGIWLWGFTDRHTWVTHFYHDDEPLIYDEDYGRKEAYYGLREALSSITPGGIVGGNVPLDSDFDEEGNSWGYLWMQPEPEIQPTTAGYVESARSDSGDDFTDDGDDDGDDAGNDKPDWEIPQIT
jgi:endo-1,4-beta-xylanase